MQPPVVILVGPQHPGNVGAAARGAANFGCVDFRVVDPQCDIRGNEALNRAKHAKDLLLDARVTATLPEALEGVSMAVGTTARTALAENRFQRKPLDIREYMDTLRGWDGTLAWVFGREADGLTGAEVDELDQLVTVPTSDYWSLNLSHAVSICCYEHYRLRAAPRTAERQLDPNALLAMNRAWDALIEETEPREWRRRTARGVWRKVIGRSAPDTFEVHNVMGILANALKRFGRPGYQTPSSQQHLSQMGLLVKDDLTGDGKRDKLGDEE